MYWVAWLFVLVLLIFLIRCVWLNYYRLTWPWNWKRKKISINKIKNWKWTQISSTKRSGVIILTAPEKIKIWQVVFAQPIDDKNAHLHICKRQIWKNKIALREMAGLTFFLCLDEARQAITIQIETMSVSKARILGIPIY